MNPQQELEEFLEVYDGEKVVGDTWFVLDSEWWEAWKGYVRYVEHGVKPKSSKKPGKIANGDLEGAFKGSVRDDVLLDVDYVLLPRKAWDFLHKEYKGGPTFGRFVIFDTKLRIEMDPPTFSVFLANMAGMPDKKSKKVMNFSRNHTTKFIQERVIKTMKIKAESITIHIRDEDKDDDWLELPKSSKVNLSNIGDAIRYQVLCEKNESWREELRAGSAIDGKSDKGLWFEATVLKENQKEGTVLVHFKGWHEKFDKWFPRTSNMIMPAYSHTDNWRVFSVDDVLEVSRVNKKGKIKWYAAKVIELDEEQSKIQAEVEYSSAETNEEWFEFASERLANEGTHIAKASDDKDDLKSIELTDEVINDAHVSIRGKPPIQGAIGFQNLGNTCFMNSINQCISNSEPLTRYFLANKHLPEINKDNFMGAGGKVALSWGELIQELWSGEYQLSVPRAWKTAIGEVNETFAGYQQQDAQEYLAFQVDTLHEDLNRVLKKPATNSVDGGGREAEVVAKESWDTFRMRNDSIMVDLCMGMSKSALCCTHESGCDYASLTFDIYSLLSVPLPQKSNRVVVVMVFFKGEKPIKCGASIPRTGGLWDVQKWLVKTFRKKKPHLTWHHFVTVDIIGNRLFRIFNHDLEIFNVSQTDGLNIYEVNPLNYHKPTAQEMEDEEHDDLSDGVKVHRPNDEVEGALIQVLHREAMPAAALRVCGTYGSDGKGQRRFGVMGHPHLVDVDYEMEGTALYKKMWEMFSHYAVGGDFDAEKNPPWTLMETDVSGAHPGKVIACGGDTVALGAYGQRKKCVVVDWKPGAFEYKVMSQVMNHTESLPRRAKAAGGDDELDDPDSIKITDCIEKYVEPEYLGEGGWTCPRCENKVNAMKKIDLWSVPELCCFQLKRFAFMITATGVSREKIETLVRFPIKGLDMSVYTVGPQADVPMGLMYDLYGVSNHIGGVGGGHYTAYGMNFDNNEWYTFNDAYCSECEDCMRTNSKFAYLIFYKRRYSDDELVKMKEIHEAEEAGERKGSRKESAKKKKESRKGSKKIKSK